MRWSRGAVPLPLWWPIASQWSWWGSRQDIPRAQKPYRSWLPSMRAGPAWRREWCRLRWQRCGRWVPQPSEPGWVRQSAAGATKSPPPCGKKYPQPFRPLGLRPPGARLVLTCRPASGASWQRKESALNIPAHAPSRMTRCSPIAGTATPEDLQDWCGPMSEPPETAVFSGGDPRTAELRERLGSVRRRIEKATAAAHRSSSPQLIVISKFHPADDVRRLAGLGVTDVGENRDQEAAEKSALLGDLDLRWHFVGQLQSNKAKSVVRYAHAVHSVDRPQLANALAKAVAARMDAAGRAPLRCFIQVSLDDAAKGHRGGAVPADVPALADVLAEAEGLELAGLMAVAPLGAEPRKAFEKLAAISASLTAIHPGATGISAGMSQDLEAAIEFGATHLRIGSDILGSRPALR